MRLYDELRQRLSEQDVDPPPSDDELDKVLRFVLETYLGWETAVYQIKRETFNHRQAAKKK